MFCRRQAGPSYYISPPGPHAITRTTFRYDNERELRQLNRGELEDKGRQRKVPLIHDSSDQLINDILLTNRLKIINDTMNDYNQGALEYTLPWPIIQCILTYASQYNSRCTCVNRDELKKTVQSIRLYNTGEVDHQHQLVLHANMMTQGDIKQHSLTRDQLCPLHQFNLDQGYEPSFVLCHQSFNRNVPREGFRWMRSMALLSKRIFAFISTTLFTNIVMDPTADTWSHITNNYCIIKQPKILTLVSPSSDTQLFFTNKSQSSSSSSQFLKNVEKIYINNPHLVEKVSTIESLVNLTPSLRSITINCYIEQSVLIDLFKGPLKSITSINVAQERIEFRNFIQPTSCLTKIILPSPFDWNSDLDVVSLSKSNISTLKTNHVDFLDYNKIESLKKLILFSKTDVCQDQFNHYNSIGFDYFGSSFSVQSNTKKLIYFKKDEPHYHCNMNIGININNNNNNNNIQIDQEFIQINVFSLLSTINTSYSNSVLPKPIIHKIIGMTWKLRERCTCVYEKETIQKWIKIGYDILKDEQELDRFNQMKNNCPTHFSHTQPYQPLTYDLKSSNRSKLQLALINKDLFKYITNNCFSVVNIEHFGDSSSIQHINNPYCVAFKQFTTIKGNNSESLINFKDNHLPHITKVILNNNNIQSIFKLLPNLTSISMKFTEPTRFDATDLCHLKHLTKLDISKNRETSIKKGAQLFNEIKDLPIKKLCISNWTRGFRNQVPELSTQFIQSITKISADILISFEITFPNLNHVVIDSWFTTSKFKVPKTVTKITSYHSRIEFLVHNRSVRTFKFKNLLENICRGQLDLFLKTISSIEYFHIQTLVYSANHSFHVPSDLYDDFKYQIDYSRTRLDYNNSFQYLKLSRIDDPAPTKFELYRKSVHDKIMKKLQTILLSLKNFKDWWFK
ncbi:hypothetical protein DFA_11347 [Cavenderia fasciculata]|uniref:Uncharacterized protein n=1 Tax=Cavenderia fasciculata TaxID=261658 RepID=F4QCF1_CACFS|nr:uncharacterized protein DFA_11347 [Cavenderia fasciculata]EGG13586.1 hypothetical protein DFA_11347 [Cavenderia fasciculata]|eukprot:XP_004350290.1 hypothetical protein DFA_11347 [Cavenderia fasciculata]